MRKHLQLQFLRLRSFIPLHLIQTRVLSKLGLLSFSLSVLVFLLLFVFTPFRSFSVQLTVRRVQDLHLSIFVSFLKPTQTDTSQDVFIEVELCASFHLYRSLGHVDGASTKLPSSAPAT